MASYNFQGKNINYEVIGEGIPLLLLHGNSVSSKMFKYIVELYVDKYQLILIDFIGHGDSDRLNKFETDFWYDQALQGIGLIEHLNLGCVNLLGTSGGALTALNIALERPDLIGKVIADSFEGEKPLKSIVESIANERLESKLIEGAQQFWYYNHGDDWENVVDNDTTVILEHYNKIGKFYHRPLEELQIQTLYIGSKTDEYFPDLECIYRSLVDKTTNSKMYLFEDGGHPSIISNAELFSEIVKTFI